MLLSFSIKWLPFSSLNHNYFYINTMVLYVLILTNEDRFEVQIYMQHTGWSDLDKNWAKHKPRWDIFLSWLFFHNMGEGTDGERWTVRLKILKMRRKSFYKNIWMKILKIIGTCLHEMKMPFSHWTWMGRLFV